MPVTWCSVMLQAISDFLQSMGLTAKQLAARPELVDLIASYHFAPGRSSFSRGCLGDGHIVAQQ